MQSDTADSITRVNKTWHLLVKYIPIKS